MSNLIKVYYSVTEYNSYIESEIDNLWDLGCLVVNPRSQFHLSIVESKLSKYKDSYYRSLIDTCSALIYKKEADTQYERNHIEISYAKKIDLPIYSLQYFKNNIREIKNAKGRYSNQ